MKLLTKQIEKKMPGLGAQEHLMEKAIAHVKFFTPDSNWTWWASEFCPETERFFGLVDGLEVEFGYFSLAELQSVRGALGLPIERDLHFSPTDFETIKKGIER